MNTGKLYLIPNLLGDTDPALSLPAGLPAIINTISTFFVEDIRSARRFLKSVGFNAPLDIVHFELLNEHSKKEDIIHYIGHCKDGKDAGIISEAGCPGVADPGAELVKLAHKAGIIVVPLTGPSSILLALMASGMNGQNFTFNGYLPKEKEDRIRRIKELEKTALLKDQTQIFIETPYRNEHLLSDILENCATGTRLCIACDITLATEFIQTKNIGEWINKKPDITKRPAVFLIGK